jgi:hypothetical protein
MAHLAAGLAVVWTPLLSGAWQGASFGLKVVSAIAAAIMATAITMKTAARLLQSVEFDAAI